jgi:hypothetical protein
MKRSFGRAFGRPALQHRGSCEACADALTLLLTSFCRKAG